MVKCRAQLEGCWCSRGIPVSFRGTYAYLHKQRTCLVSSSIESLDNPSVSESSVNICRDSCRGKWKNTSRVCCEVNHEFE